MNLRYLFVLEGTQSTTVTSRSGLPGFLAVDLQHMLVDYGRILVHQVTFGTLVHRLVFHLVHLDGYVLVREHLQNEIEDN